MSQHDYVLANQTGANFRSDLNNALLAIVSQNSGASEPATMYGYQWWADTTSGNLKLRNAANSAWITVGSLSLTNLGLASLAGATFTGALLAAVGTVSLPGISFSGDADSGIYWVSSNVWELVSGGVAYARISSDGITFLGTGATIFPSGTTGQRPGSPVNGMIRYNTTTAAMDVYTNGAWALLPGVTAYPFATADFSDSSITLQKLDPLLLPQLPKAWVNYATVPITGCTYSQSGTTVTVTKASHGLSVGWKVNVDITSGTAVDGMYTITSAASGSFTYTAGTSLTTSGNATLKGYIKSSYNVSSITYHAIGESSINFTNALNNSDYCVVFGTLSNTTAGSDRISYAAENNSTVVKSTTQLRVCTKNSVTDTSPATDNDFFTISVVIFGT